MPEVQFLIKNICPHVEEAFPGSNAKLEEAFPDGVCIWVLWPWQEIKSRFCPGRKMRMATQEMGRLVGVYDRVGTIVCEHMGQVIE